MAKVATLVHPDARLQVPARLLISKCDLFADDPGRAAAPYTLKSQISVGDLRDFVSALEGTTVKVTNNNFKGLSQLCEEFHFRDLAAQLSQFRNSADFPKDALPLSARADRLSAMEEQMHHGRREIASLRDELSRQSRLQESLEKHISELRSEVGTLSTALSEVRERAENGHRQSESTEAPQTVPPPAPPTQNAAPAAAVPPPPAQWQSVIRPDVPKLFDIFKNKTFTLLWRGSRDGFGAGDFHGRCDGHANTLTVILDTDDNIFGGFTPVRWESRTRPPYNKADPSVKSFLFTLANPESFPRRDLC
jgi:hypothetical protein